MKRDRAFEILSGVLGNLRVRQSEKLKYHIFNSTNSLADIFFLATSQKELIKALDLSFKNKINTTLIGGGTKTFMPGSTVRGFVIKNKANSIRVVSIKGKVGKGNIGVEKISAEIDSGATFEDINRFISFQNLKPVDWLGPLQGTVGGAVFLEPYFKEVVEKIKVWEKGEVFEVDFPELKNRKHIIISITCSFEAN